MFKSGCLIVADILDDCSTLEVLKLSHCEVTNGKDEAMGVRRGKEPLDSIVDDMEAVESIMEVLARHEKVVELDLEGNSVEDRILRGIALRLKVNRSLLHTKRDFEKYVDAKFNLKTEELKRERRDHKTNVGVDYEHFER